MVYLNNYSMKKIFIIILTFLYSLNVFSQDQECGTHDPTEAQMRALPYYGNNAYLDHYVDSLTNVFNNPANRIDGREEGVWYRVPIQFFVYQWQGEDVITREGRNMEKTLKTMMYHLNEAMRRNNTKIRFYMLCPRVINHQTATTGFLENYAWEALQYIYTAGQPALECHIVNDVEGGNFYSPEENVIFMRASATIDRILEYQELGVTTESDEANSTFVHEVGHWLGLQHTHLNNNVPCLKESVSREIYFSICPPFISRWCELRGDFLCDTPADPDLSQHITDVMANCSWFTNIRDDRGDFYAPDTRNYMSYSRVQCRKTFTESQKKVMILGMNAQIGWQNFNFQLTPSNAFDSYEPDNEPIYSSFIAFNVPQIHSFSDVGCNDDDDWVKFNNGADAAINPPYTSDLVLEVESVAGFNFPVLEVEMWDGGVSGAYETPNNTTRVPYTQTNIQPSKITYTISCTLPRGRTYLFRVVRNGNQTGRYQITLKKVPNNITINGSDIVCNNLVSFSATSTQVGINIPFSWEVSTNLQIVSGQGTNAIMVSPINPNVGGTGFVRLVYNNICIGQQQVQKNIWVGKPAITSGLMDANFQPITEATLYISEPCPDNNPPRPTHLPVACFNGFGTQGYNNIFEIEDIIGNASQYYSLESTSSIPRGCIRFFQTGYYEFRVRAKNTNCINTNSDWLVFRITVMEDPNLPQCIDPDPIPPDVCYDEWGQAYLCPSGYRYYPNISQGDLNIDYSENYQKLEIYNKYNQKVFETNLDKKKGRKLNLRKLPNDVYFLHLIDKKGLSVKKQLVIQK